MNTFFDFFKGICAVILTAYLGSWAGGNDVDVAYLTLVLAFFGTIIYNAVLRNKPLKP